MWGDIYSLTQTVGLAGDCIDFKCIAISMDMIEPPRSLHTPIPIGIGSLSYTSYNVFQHLLLLLLLWSVASSGKQTKSDFEEFITLVLYC